MKQPQVQQKQEIKDRRIEIQVNEAADGRPEVLLQDLNWGSGVGWYVQKTLRLDAEHIQALMGSLCQARQGLDKTASERTTPANGCNACQSSADEHTPANKIVLIRDLIDSAI